jgi:hypothetical protein
LADSGHLLTRVAAAAHPHSVRTPALQTCMRTTIKHTCYYYLPTYLPSLFTPRIAFLPLQISPHLNHTQIHTDGMYCTSPSLPHFAILGLCLGPALQALSMMCNGKRSDCNALLVSLVAPALPVLNSCPSRCPRLACAVSARCFRGHPHPAKPRVSAFAAVELHGHQYTIPLVGAQPRTAPMRPGQRLRVNSLPAQHLTLKSLIHPLSHFPTLPFFTHLKPRPAGATLRSRRRTQGDDSFKTEKT